jgi:hypothetical protein
MEFLKPFGMVVNSIEITKSGKENPVITHISWGDSIDEALALMKSHLITDYFLAATFAGEMTLRDNKLIITYSGKLISIHSIVDYSKVERTTEDVFNKLSQEVQKIMVNSRKLGIPELINQLSKMK